MSVASTSVYGICSILRCLSQAIQTTTRHAEGFGQTERATGDWRHDSRGEGVRYLPGRHGAGY